MKKFYFYNSINGTVISTQIEAFTELGICEEEEILFVEAKNKKEATFIIDDVDKLLLNKGFKHIAAGNGCHEYWNESYKEGLFQINGEELSKIESFVEPVFFSIFTPECVSIYEKRYENLIELLQQEEKLK